jgi:predicted Holliday junction resolvase-like endonuclease
MTRLLRKQRKRMIDPTVGGVLVVCAVLIIFLFFVMAWLQWRKTKKEIEEYRKENVALIKKYHKELHFRKSSEVRLGKIGENLAPFVKCWPWDPNNFRFLGNPVDGIQFDEDEVIFVEIKTGGARLSKSQKNFRDLVKAGKVSFATFKITEDGVNLKRE